MPKRYYCPNCEKVTKKQKPCKKCKVPTVMVEVPINFLNIAGLVLAIFSVLFAGGSLFVNSVLPYNEVLCNGSLLTFFLLLIGGLAISMVGDSIEKKKVKEQGKQKAMNR